MLALVTTRHALLQFATRIFAGLPNSSPQLHPFSLCGMLLVDLFSSFDFAQVSRTAALVKLPVSQRIASHRVTTVLYTLLFHNNVSDKSRHLLNLLCARAGLRSSTSTFKLTRIPHQTLECPVCLVCCTCAFSTLMTPLIRREEGGESRMG